ncbi:outer membrane protein assembly factor BamB family protein [Streptomyces europaeiscabiei]|uniref:outer membrane protein assembly factor BamB family protein n=1 Tax=Streptomyces europaeiscabiei TaxID=146819 RepID=UPI0029B13758|nr:PQQ-binding-like beta-propeller repeat protein [Streptomyces europaeiscabiei]MDX3848497.1 PQQ-binding-like beta-propeller repeat protein [Streptomyces europaeiscabiei]
MATVSQNRRTERAGVNALRSFLDEHDHLVQEMASGTDHGEDCFVMLTRGRKRTGYSFTAQVKAGRKYKRARGYAIDVGDHFTDWRASKVPVVGVVYDIDEQRMFWINLTLHLSSVATAPRWVQIPWENELCTASLDAFVTHIEEFTDAPGQFPANAAGSPAAEDAPSSRGRTDRGRAHGFRAPVRQWTKSTAAPNARQPHVVQGYAVVRQGHLIRVLDAASGTEAWSARTAFDRHSPAGDEALYVSASAGRLRAIALHSGRTRWEQPLRVRDDLAACVSRTLYAPDDRGRIFAVETSSGRVRWVSAASGRRLAAPVCVDDEAVFALRGPSAGEDAATMSSGTFDVVALGVADGVERWRHRAGAVLSPAWTLADDVLYVVERPDEDTSVLVALAAGTGSPLWRSPLPAPVSSAVTVSGEFVYVCGRRGGLYRVSRCDGTWRLSSTSAGLTASPVVADGTVVVNMGRSLAAFDALDGASRWVRRLPGLALGQPFALGVAVYIGHRTGVLACDIETGRRLWSDDDLVWDPERQGDPATTADALYLTDRRGVVHCFHAS